MIPANEALERLKEGNHRFASGAPSRDLHLPPARRAELAKGQQPFAVVLGCSDSRVPVEMVFDRGLGDLFVVRVAGNIAAPSQLGSIEFAAAQLGVRLVVVLGHSHCGAVKATLEDLRHPQQDHPDNLRSLVEHVRPSVEGLLKADHARDIDSLMHEAVRANVERSVSNLRQGSEVLERMIDNKGLVVVGGTYSLETGVVDFLGGA